MRQHRQSEHNTQAPQVPTAPALTAIRPFGPTPAVQAEALEPAAESTLQTNQQEDGRESLGHSFDGFRIFPTSAGAPAGPPGDPNGAVMRTTSPLAPARPALGTPLPAITPSGDATRVARVPGTAAPAPAGPTTAPPAPTAAPAAGHHAGPIPADLRAFLHHGTFGPQTLQPPTNIGGFDASYSPTTKLLKIKVNASIDFQNGLTLAGGTITANHTGLTQAATDGNNLPVNRRAGFVRQFTWNAAQKDGFTSTLEARVSAAWSRQHSFQCTKPQWEAVTAQVAAQVAVHKGAAKPTDHLHIRPFKVPASGTYNIGAAVTPNGGANNNDLEMSSAHVGRTPQSQALLRRSVSFGSNSAALDGTATSTLGMFIADFQTNNVPKSNPVQLIGHSSASGSAAHNSQLAQQRVDAVQAHLVSNGFTGVNQRVHTQNKGSTGATADPSFQRVDLVVGSGQGQLVAAHEFGHVFGLKDEYAINAGGNITGTGNPTGTIVGHDAMAKAVGAPGAIAENNDNIMSLGNNVQPQHYATFGWALQQVTGVPEWQVH